MKNAIWYLGFLSLLSLLYFARGTWTYLCFLGFLPYFVAYWAKDERVEINVGRASRNAFLYVVASGAASIVYVSLTKDIAAFAWAFALVFSGCIIICVLSFLYYDLGIGRNWKRRW
ncbi:MAG: DUF3796 domain-containing protein [Theionarchaea archaeon]|nr:MAG: hypothetical protein AYK18_18330 [Theionarchaea archaeon DG-70]MBU7013116.1 DUF3796 domain-containing protein [Theionarchaea archaeon]